MPFLAGVVIETRQLVAVGGLQYLTNHLCPIGSWSVQIENDVPYTFTMHQPCFVGSSCPVHDPVVAQWRDLSGSAYQNPPMNWPWPGYWQVDHRPTLDEFGSGFWGLVNGHSDGVPEEGEEVAVYSPLLVTLYGLKN